MHLTRRCFRSPFLPTNEPIAHPVSTLSKRSWHFKRYILAVCYCLYTRDTEEAKHAYISCTHPYIHKYINQSINNQRPRPTHDMEKHQPDSASHETRPRSLPPTPPKTQHIHVPDTDTTVTYSLCLPTLHKHNSSNRPTSAKTRDTRAEPCGASFCFLRVMGLPSSTELAKKGHGDCTLHESAKATETAPRAQKTPKKRKKYFHKTR